MRIEIQFQEAERHLAQQLSQKLGENVVVNIKVPVGVADEKLDRGVVEFLVNRERSKMRAVMQVKRFFPFLSLIEARKLAEEIKPKW